jgi:hypothetical protein
MKINKLLLLFSALIIVSCNEDFLEEFPTSYITPEQIAEASVVNPDLQAATVAGIYESMYKYGTGSANDGFGRNDRDFGHRNYDIFGDMLSGDMALSAKNYGWYSEMSELTATVDYSEVNNYQTWRYFYRIVNLANIVIDGLGGTDATPESTSGKHFLGQALAARAYGYFYLVNYFVDDITTDAKSLPLYLDTSSPNVEKSSTAVIMAAAVADLIRAKALLDDYTRPSTSNIDKYVASTLLAYTYAAMGNNAGAAAEAEYVVTNSGYTVITNAQATDSGFNDINELSASVIWGTDLTTDSNQGLRSWWGQVDIYSYSYAWAGDRKIMDRGLYANIPADDVRKTQFLDNAASGYDMTPYRKFYHGGRVIGGQRVITTDYIYFRVAEMYLLHAETKAKSGDEAAAKLSLKEVVSKRVPDASYIDSLSGQALLDEILIQIRIELWGEGKSYLSVKRNKLDVVRGPNWLDFPNTTYKSDDNKLTFEIPEEEIRDNPFVNEQN